MIRVLFIVGLLCLYLPVHATAQAGVIFPETTYDFGTVKQGSKVVHRFAVKNSTTKPLPIRSVQFSIPGVNARFTPVVEPGGEGAITLEWDTSHVSGEMDGETTVLLGDGSDRPATLLLKALVLPPLGIQPFPAVFLSTFRGEDNESRLRITNNDDEPTHISLSAAAGKHFIASLTTIKPGRIYELVARVPSAALPGRYDEELSLSTDNPKLGNVMIPVHLFIKPDLYANPEAINFGRVSAEELRKNPATREFLTQTFLVKKRQGEFEIMKITSDLDWLQVRKDPPNGKRSTYRVDVALDPQKLKPGKLEGSVEIITDDRDFPSIRVPVTGTAF